MKIVRLMAVAAILTASGAFQAQAQTAPTPKEIADFTPLFAAALMTHIYKGLALKVQS